jgi:hypothetical protein
MHAPPEHADATHGVVEPHVPLELQTSVLLPEHRVAPGVQTPTQLPFEHAWLVHDVGDPNVPVDEQV